MFEEGSFRRRPRGFRRKCHALKPYNYYPPTSAGGATTGNHNNGAEVNNGPNNSSGNELGSPGSSLYHPHTLGGGVSHHLHYHSHPHSHDSLSLNGLSQNGSPYPSAGNSSNSTGAGIVSSSSGGGSSMLGPGEYPLSPSSAISVIQNNPFVYTQQHQPQSLVTSLSLNGSSPSATPSYMVSTNPSPYDPLPFYASSPPQQHYESLNYQNSAAIVSAGHYANSCSSEKGSGSELEQPPRHGTTPPGYHHHIFGSDATPSNSRHHQSPTSGGVSATSHAANAWLLNYCGPPVTSSSNYFGNSVPHDHPRNSVSPNQNHSESNTPPYESSGMGHSYGSSNIMENHEDLISNSQPQDTIGTGLIGKETFGNSIKGEGVEGRRCQCRFRLPSPQHLLRN